MASPGAALPLPSQDKWSSPDASGALLSDPDVREPPNGSHLNDDDRSAPLLDPAPDYRSDAGGQKSITPREKQVKPNKVYVGGLPEHTSQVDLRDCFGKMGDIVNIELKLGYGFVEFDTREAAEESVAKYNEGFFMGNKIRVEMSHGGGRTAKYNGDPGACFKCGLTGHWARECPNHSAGPRRGGHYIDHRDYPPTPRDSNPYRDDYGRYPPARDLRYSYDYPPPPPRDVRRPLTPPRDYRDYPPVLRPPRDFDDYRMRPPPGPPRPYYANDPPYPRGYDGPPRDLDRGVDRRGPPPPPGDRYPPYSGTRPRTPPGPPPSRVRDDYDRPTRDYPPTDYRGRPTTPPMASRYGEYPPRTGGSDASVPRYRRRSQSPPPRSGGSNHRSAPYPSDHGSDTAAYPTPSASYSASAGYSGNGYSVAAGSVPSRNGGSARDREYPSRNDAEPAGYSRRT